MSRRFFFTLAVSVLTTIAVLSPWAMTDVRAQDCTPAPSSNLNGCVYDGQNLTGESFHSSSLRFASFVGVTFIGPLSDMGSVTATDANFTNANLAGSDLSSSNFNRANFTNANLLGADTASSSFRGATFCNTTMPSGSINNSGC